MKKVLFSLVAMSLLATTFISCQSNQKGTEEGGADSTTIATTADSATATTSVSIASAKNEILDVSPNVTVKTPQFSNEDVNGGFAKFEPLKQEYIAAITSNDAAKIKEVTTKFNAWVKDAATWGSKLTQEENQIYIDHYTKLVTQWDKLSLKVKK